MNVFEKILKYLSFKVATPTFFSTFHLVSLLLVVVATVGVSLWFYLKRPSEKTVRLVVLIAWISIVLLELYKQLAFSFKYDETLQTATWKYSWNIFPFQFCSSALYVFPFVALLKAGKVRDAFLSFVCTFCLFGGLIVVIYPGNVFCASALINVQSMIHHGVQVLIGVSLIVYYRRKFTWKFFLPSLIIYAIFIAIAQLLNGVLPPLIGDESQFNMFYISWKYPCALPLLNIVYEKAPYVVFFFGYLFGFIAVSAIVFAIIKLVLYLSALRRKKAETGANDEK